jgi:hypothetical protein
MNNIVEGGGRSRENNAEIIRSAFWFGRPHSYP